MSSLDLALEARLEFRTSILECYDFSLQVAVVFLSSELKMGKGVCAQNIPRTDLRSCSSEEALEPNKGWL